MRGVTKATAFSFQSVITSANADGAGAISAIAASTLRRLACMLCSPVGRMSGSAECREATREDLNLLRCHYSEDGTGVMRHLWDLGCIHPVPDLYRALNS